MAIRAPGALIAGAALLLGSRCFAQGPPPNTAPGPPSNVQAVDTPNDTGGSITVTWGLSGDDGAGAADVVDYVVYRGSVDPGNPPTRGIVVGTVPAATSLFLDNSTVDGTSYYYRVTARDSQYQSTAAGPAGPAQSRDNRPPSPPTGVTAADVPNDQGGSISITWQLSQGDRVGGLVTGYAIYRRLPNATGWTRVATVPAGAVATIDSSVPKNVPHQYMLRALNEAIESVDSNVTAAVAGWDNIRPGACSRITAEDEAPDQGKSILVYWALSPDDGGGANDVVEYRVLRSTVAGYAGEIVGTATAGSGFYRDIHLLNEVTYYYTVQAYDGYLLSPFSPQTAGVKSIDNVSPGPPWALSAVDTPKDNGHSISLTWKPSADDGKGAKDVVWYDVYRSETAPVGDALGERIGQVPGGTWVYTDLPLPDGVNYWYTVRARDDSHPSDPSNTSGPVRAADNIPPGVPPKVTAAVTALPGQEAKVIVQWAASADDIPGGDVEEDRLYRSTSRDTFGQPLQVLPAGSDQYEDLRVPPEQEFYYMVRAFDGELLSDPSQVAGPVKVRDVIAPDPPTNVTATSGPDSVMLRWDASPSDDVVGYNLYRSTDPVVGYAKVNSIPITALQYTDTQLTARRVYYYCVSALDEAIPPNESPRTQPVSAPALDLTPPAPPTGLLPSVSNGEVSLRWTANVEPDLAGYDVYRRAPNGTAFVRMNDSLLQDPFFVDTAVTNLLTYQYRITAVDTADIPNESSPSEAVTAMPENVQKMNLATGLHLVSFSRSGTDARPALGLGLTGSDWRLARWWPPSQDALYHVTSPDRLDAIASLDPPDCQGPRPTVPRPPAGLGYWIRVMRPTELTVRGETVPATADYPVRLQAGWNLIGNPFDASVRWSGVATTPAQAIGPVAWGYDEARAYYPVFASPVTGGSTGLDPGRGYWVYATQDAVLSLPGPDVAAAARDDSAGVRAADAGVQWMLRLEARCGAARDLSVWVGVGDAAAGSPLVRGLASPPNVGPSVDLYLRGPEPQLRYASGFLPAGVREGDWELFVDTEGLEGEVEVLCADLRALPRELTASLCDVETGRRCDLRSGATLRVPAGAERRLRLEVRRVGGGRLVSGVTVDALARGAAVRYTLAGSCFVTITVRNGAGRIVRTLALDSVQPPGTHEAQLARSSDAGAALPSGHYSLEVEARSSEGGRARARTSFEW